MIKFFRAFTVILLSFCVSAAMAQTSTATTSSPYSRYGIGSLVQPWLPQNRAMGGISTATNLINGYSTINLTNPAAYAFMNITTIDIGLASSIITLNKTGAASQTNSNFNLSHVAFGIPITKRSAISFGLTPYSQVGYNYKQTISRGFGSSSPADTNLVNNIYSGDGGLSKAYLGYGFAIGRHLAFGANVSYIFGNLEQFQSAEYPQLYGVFNSRQQSSNAVGGVNYDFGVQYIIPFSDEERLTLGYSTSISTQLNSQTTIIATQYQTNFATNTENNPLDTLMNQQNPVTKLKLPQINHFGISYQADRRFIVGADYNTGKWSALTIGGVNQGLQNSSSLSVGGQFNPNSNSLNNYWDVVDYRLGAHFDKTNVIINNQGINQYGVTFGLGLPLTRNGSSYYKVNFTGEVGKMGTLSNSLIKETYFNIHIGITLNDRWFNRPKFD
jgi:hypothetical protein